MDACLHISFYVHVHFCICVLYVSYVALNLSPSSELARFYLEIQFSGFS